MLTPWSEALCWCSVLRMRIWDRWDAPHIRWDPVLRLWTGVSSCWHETQVSQCLGLTQPTHHHLITQCSSATSESTKTLWVTLYLINIKIYLLTLNFQAVIIFLCWQNMVFIIIEAFENINSFFQELSNLTLNVWH